MRNLGQGLTNLFVLPKRVKPLNLGLEALKERKIIYQRSNLSEQQSQALADTSQRWPSDLKQAVLSILCLEEEKI